MPGVGIGIRPNLPETQAETPKFDFLFLIFPRSVHHRLILLIHPVYLILLRAPYVEYSGDILVPFSEFRGFLLFILVVATYVKKTIREKDNNTCNFKKFEGGTVIALDIRATCFLPPVLFAVAMVKLRENFPRNIMAARPVSDIE